VREARCGVQAGLLRRCASRNDGQGAWAIGAGRAGEGGRRGGRVGDPALLFEEAAAVGERWRGDA
jgi:hypothetical protein